MDTAVDKPARLSSFPFQEVEALLRTELMTVAKAEADMNGLILPEKESEIARAPIPMDSLVVVEILCSVESVLGFPPKEGAVRTGGYNSVQDALDHMLPRLEKQWRKNQGRKA